MNEWLGFRPTVPSTFSSSSSQVSVLTEGSIYGSSLLVISHFEQL